MATDRWNEVATVNPILALFVAFIAIVPASIQIKADRAEIRLSPKKDRTIRFVVSKMAVETIEVGETTERFETASESSVDLALKNETSEGTLELSMKHGAIKGAYQGGGSTKPIPFDSERLEATDAATKDEDLARLLKSETIDAGIEVALKLARDSEILEVRGYGAAVKPKIDSLYSDLPADDLEAKLAHAHGTDGHLQASLINVLPRLPRNAVAIGDEFTLERGWHECPLEAVCFEIALRCKVTALDAETISVEVHGEMPTPAEVDERTVETFTLRAFTITGKLVFSRRDGFLRSLDIEQNADSLTPGAGGILPVKKTVTIRYRRADS